MLNLKFEIVSSRTVDGVDKEKKFVAYMVQARQSKIIDPEPANVERRYTHFLDLYNGLKKEYPSLMNKITFPRKVSIINHSSANSLYCLEMKIYFFYILIYEVDVDLCTF